MKVEIEFDMPEGFEATGEYRPPVEEWFTDVNGGKIIALHGTAGIPRVILRKIGRVPVLPADCGKKVRVSDDKKTWWTGTLVGYDGTFPGWRARTLDPDEVVFWAFCEIDDE